MSLMFDLPENEAKELHRYLLAFSSNLTNHIPYLFKFHPKFFNCWGKCFQVYQNKIPQAPIKELPIIIQSILEQLNPNLFRNLFTCLEDIRIIIVSRYSKILINREQSRYDRLIVHRNIQILKNGKPISTLKQLAINKKEFYDRILLHYHDDSMFALNKYFVQYQQENRYLSIWQLIAKSINFYDIGNVSVRVELNYQEPYTGSKVKIRYQLHLVQCTLIDNFNDPKATGTTKQSIECINPSYEIERCRTSFRVLFEKFWQQNMFNLPHLKPSGDETPPLTHKMQIDNAVRKLFNSPTRPGSIQ